MGFVEALFCGLEFGSIIVGQSKLSLYGTGVTDEMALRSDQGAREKTRPSPTALDPQPNPTPENTEESSCWQAIMVLRHLAATFIIGI